MNIQPTEYKNKKYTLKPTKISRGEPDTSQYNLTKEEVAESVIRSLDGAIKDMKSGKRSRSLDELLKEAYEYIAEEEKNGRY